MTYTRASLLLICAAVLSAVVGVARADALRAGSYESADGDLNVRSEHGALTFQLESVGANGHTCSLEGEIHGARAELEGQDGPCLVDFRPRKGGVNVSGNDACRYWCGARAHFDGFYSKPAAGCASRERTDTHAGFQRSYDAKNYAAARAQLEPVLSNCAEVLGWLEKASLRNDLAVTLYHLRERSACLAVLAPLADDAAKSDAALREEYPPSDADNYLPLVKAARVNLKLCRGIAGSG